MSIPNLTLGDLMLLIPMAFAGALFLGAIPCSSKALRKVLRTFGVLLGIMFAMLLVEGLPVLI